MAQNVLYSNGQPSPVTLPFEYWILSGIQVSGIQIVTVTVFVLLGRYGKYVCYCEARLASI